MGVQDTFLFIKWPYIAWMKSLVLKLYAAWVLTVFTVFMIIFLPGLTIPFFFGNRFSRVGFAFLWIWSWIFSQLTGIRYKFHGRDKIVRGKAYIYVSNHTSFLDLPGLRLMIPSEFKPLAKKELLKIPIFGWIAKGACVIVDRSSPESRKRSIDRLKRTLAHGIPLLIFAEGTQNRTKEVLQPFKDGAFRIAIDTQATILPLVVIGAGKLMPPSTLKLRPGTIHIYAGEEIDVREYTETVKLKEKTFEVMTKLIERNRPQSTVH
jgi:1-acyl-sn-glycerol-3-phosphate acyltransferase